MLQALTLNHFTLQEYNELLQKCDEIFCGFEKDAHRSLEGNWF